MKLHNHDNSCAAGQDAGDAPAPAGRRAETAACSSTAARRAEAPADSAAAAQAAPEIPPALAGRPVPAAAARISPAPAGRPEIPAAAAGSPTAGSAPAPDSIYGTHLPELEAVRARLLADIGTIRRDMARETGFDPVEHCLSRIKSEESMREKCRRRGLPETTESALMQLYDAVGIRVICAFLQDVYVIRDRIAALPGVEFVQEKDYIRCAKPNGYRSLHLILRVRGTSPADRPGQDAAPVPLSPAAPPLPFVYAEIQLRTISQDTWAALEHQMRYKKEIGGNTALIAEELKRCADELASTDVSMQTIRDLINS